METILEKIINIFLVVFLVAVFFGSSTQIAVVAIAYAIILGAGGVYYYRKHPEKLRWHR